MGKPLHKTNYSPSKFQLIGLINLKYTPTRLASLGTGLELRHVLEPPLYDENVSLLDSR